ncbi:MAG TPA: BMP family ABC transporter substrate-binding protein, partial [Gaiellaceae bacterium]
MRSRKIGAVLALAGAVAIVAGYGASASSATSTARTATQTKAFVVLVTDVNQLNDHGFNALAYQGLLRARAKLGINGVVYQSPSAAQYIPNLATAARKGADLVISVGFDQAVAVAKVAKQFPKTNFAIIDVDQTTLAGKPKNVEGLIFKEQEVGYLAGYLAGLVEKQKAG